MNIFLRRALSSAYPALSSGLVMGAIGMLGLAAGQPWLFPSLGPTIFLQTVTPQAPGARTWNIVAGHTLGVCAGFFALFLIGAHAAPAAIGGESLSWERVAATALAVTITVGHQSTVAAQHPPAAATTMLITLGSLKPTWGTIFAIAAGVSLVAALGSLVQFSRPSDQRYG